MTELKLEVEGQPEGLAEFKSLLATLEQVLEDVPSMGLEVYQLLFCERDLLRPGFIEFRGMAAAGTDRLAVSLHVTDRLRELVAAAAAGDLKGLRINE